MTIISTPHALAFALNSGVRWAVGSNFGVHPNIEIVEFRLERMKSIIEPADERLGPIPQWRTSAERIAVRVAHEYVGIEIRREVGHRRIDNATREP